MSESTENILESEVDCYFINKPLDSDVTVADYVLRNAAEHAQAGRTHCITNAISGETYNYGELDEMSRKIASGLCTNGFHTGHTVVYSCIDAAKLHIFFIGVWRANGIVRASYPEDLQGGELAARILESEAHWILCDEATAEEHLSVAATIPWCVGVIVLGRAEGCISVADLLQDDGTNMPTRQVGRDDLALILPTSGTTGTSKGTMYTHQRLLNNILYYQHYAFTDKPEEPFLSTSRLSHFTGSVVPFAFFSAGRRLLLMPNATFINIVQAISSYKVYGILTFPKNLTNLVQDPISKDYDLSSLTYVHSTGQTVDRSVVDTIKSLPSVKHMCVLYGMTECGMISATVDWLAQKQGIYKDLKGTRNGLCCRTGWQYPRWQNKRKAEIEKGMLDYLTT